MCDNSNTDAARDKQIGADALSSYSEYNKVLRTWFVAFGIGAPALFLANKDATEKLKGSGDIAVITLCLFVGTAAQVLGALINKGANWYVYIATVDETFKGTRRHRAGEWLVRQFWIDIVLDLGTVLSFGIAAQKILKVFLA